jgi:hypothetical protein
VSVAPESESEFAIHFIISMKDNYNSRVYSVAHFLGATIDGYSRARHGYRAHAGAKGLIASFAP